MRLSQLDPEKIVQCRFLCAVFQIGITEVISWSKVNDERLSNPYIFECFARGLRALPYLLAVDLTASKQTQVSASKPEKHVAKLAKPSSKKAAKQSDVQRSRSGPPQLRGNKLEQAPFSKWGIFAKVKTQERMRTVRNNIVYHAADNTVQGDPVGAETRCVDSKGQLWSPIFPDLEYLVNYYVATDQAVQKVSHEVMSENATVSTAEGTCRLLENKRVTSKLQARYDQDEINNIWPQAIKQHQMPYKMQHVTADLPTAKRIKTYLAGEKLGQDPPASKSAKVQSAYGELLIAEAGLPFAQAQKQASDCIVLDSAVQWIFFVGSILALDSALDFFNATAPKLLPSDVSTLQATVNTYVEAFSHFKVPRFEATASVDFVDLTKAELSEDAYTCVSDGIIQNIIHNVSNVKDSVRTKLRL